MDLQRARWPSSVWCRGSSSPAGGDDDDEDELRAPSGCEEEQGASEAHRHRMFCFSHFSKESVAVTSSPEPQGRSVEGPPGAGRDD